MLMQYHAGLVHGMTQALKETFIDGYYSDKVLERLFKANKKWGSRDRRFVAETVYNITRWWSLLLFFSSQKSVKDFKERDFLYIWALYERWRNSNDVVAFTNEKFNTSFSAQEIANSLKRTPQELSISVAFPSWIVKKIEEAFGSDTEALLKSLNEAAPVCLRTNTLKISKAELIKVLNEKQIEVSEIPNVDEGLILKERQNVFVTEAFRKGFFEVQDQASQRVAPLLDPKPGERIADMCAGAGGKTLHLAALMKNKGSLVACDVIPKKLEALKIRAKRAGVSNLRLHLIEGTQFVKRHKGEFDGVLVDVPCSGLGVVRRNPDTKWKLSLEEIDRLKQIQFEILTSYSRLVKKGGRLVYATCSVLPEENQGQIQRFIETNADFVLEGDPILTRPDRNEGDGFFAQKLRRK